MNRKTNRTVTLLLVVFLCLTSTCVLAVIAFFRSRQIQRFEQVAALKSTGQESEAYEIFWGLGKLEMNGIHFMLSGANSLLNSLHKKTYDTII